MTRCKKGDLAIVVESAAGNEGKVVQCLELMTGILGCIDQYGRPEEGAVWRIDRALPGWSGDCDHFIMDSQLRPIRPQGDDEVDEMVKLLGVPGEVATVLVGQGEAA